MVAHVLLYDSAVSGNCYKVRLLLAQLGRGYERHPVDVVDRSGREELLGELNPALRVPTLILDDGRPLAESGAILAYLAEGTPFLPDDRYERAKALQWMFFEQYSHEPYIAVVRFWTEFPQIAPPAERIEARRAGGYAALRAMEHHLDGRDFLVGERYTIADIALYAYTHVAHEGGFDLGDLPAVRAWLDRVREQPGHVPITAGAVRCSSPAGRAGSALPWHGRSPGAGIASPSTTAVAPAPRGRSRTRLPATGTSWLAPTSRIRTRCGPWSSRRRPRWAGSTCSSTTPGSSSRIRSTRRATRSGRRRGGGRSTST
jgi:glutathione S-transferase